MRTAVVILNWNTRDYLEAFLPSLVRSISGQDAEVYVADNHSLDGSAEYARSILAASQVIEFDSNLGFTGGYNKAIAAINAEYYVLINSDIEVPDGWLEPLVGWMDSHPGCAVCGPKLHALEKAGDGFRCCSRFEYAGAAGGYVDRYGFPFCRGRVLKMTEEDCGQYDHAAEVLWVSGACMMTRGSVWKDLGGLDDRFFAHMEEIDYCWRARLHGYSVNVIPESTVWHLGGGTLPQESPFKLKLNFRNNLLMLKKNLPGTIGPRRAAVRIFIRKCLDGAAAAVYFVTGRRDYAAAVLHAHREAEALCGNDAAKSSIRVVKGYLGICILPVAFLYGNKIFSHLKKYEDNH